MNGSLARAILALHERRVERLNRVIAAGGHQMVRKAHARADLRLENAKMQHALGASSPRAVEDVRAPALRRSER